MRIWKWKNGKTHKHTQLTVSEQSKRRKPKKKRKKLPLCTVYSTVFSLLLEQVVTRENRIKKLVFFFLLFFTTLHTFIIFLGKVKYYLVWPVIPGDFNFRPWVTVHHTCVVIVIFSFCFIIILFILNLVSRIFFIILLQFCLEMSMGWAGLGLWLTQTRPEAVGWEKTEPETNSKC